MIPAPRYRTRTWAAALSLTVALGVLTGCGPQGTETTSPPTGTVEPTVAPTAVATTEAPTAAPTTEAPTEPTESPAGQPTNSGDVLPATIGDWKLDPDLAYYERGSILDGSHETVQVFIGDDATVEGWKQILTDQVEIPGGVCGDFSTAYVCVGDTSQHGFVSVTGEKPDSIREIASVVLPLL